MPKIEMVERVARAICKSRTCEGVECCQWPSQGGRTDCPVKQGGYHDAAIDALAAIYEPTEQMTDYGLETLYENSRANGTQEVRAMWRTMIDVALDRHG